MFFNVSIVSQTIKCSRNGLHCLKLYDVNHDFILFMDKVINILSLVYFYNGLWVGWASIKEQVSGLIMVTGLLDVRTLGSLD